MSHIFDSRTFDIAYAWLLSPDIEGGYANDPDDRGGETNHGVSSKAHPGLDILGMSDEQRRAFFFRNYWLAAGCDRLPAPLAFALFDAAVLHSPRRGVMFMQQALRVQADGINGPQTQAVARRADARAVLCDMLSRRARFMFDFSVADHTQVKWLGGWLRRLFLLQRAILELPTHA